MRANNTPQAGLDDLEPDFTRETIQSLRELYDRGKPKDDAEVETRITDFFRFCAQKGMRPGIETLCAALAVSRTTLHRWRHGEDCSIRRQEAVNKAVMFINAFLEQSALRGKLNPATSIFLMKNWMGYSDNQTIEFRNESNNREPIQSVEDIKRRHSLSLSSGEDLITLDEIRPECFATSGDADEEPEKPIL